MITALLLSVAVHAATITDSWLGRSAQPIPVTTQFLRGDTVYLYLTLSLTDTKYITVRWYRKGKLVKTSVVKGTKKQNSCAVTVKALPGEWTVYAKDSTGSQRSHHFVVK
jgi:hypothetical protein